jgi:NAD(P) transhydrogenase
MGRLRAVREHQVQQISENLARHGVEVIRGHGRFVSDGEVIVERADQPLRRLRADAFLVAVGSSPHRPSDVPFSDPDVEDSDSILDLDRIPAALAVVGGGVIGCEYASIFAALGTRITIIEGREALLGFLDGEISSLLSLSFERSGHEVILKDAVRTIRRPPGGRLEMKLGSGRCLEVDKILYSAGRAGNTRGLGLEAAGVTTDARGRVLVDDRLETAKKGIFAAGDVVGAPALASVSMEQGRVAVCNAFGFDYKKRVSPLVPTGIYTVPEISMVGAREEDLAVAGVPFGVGRARFEKNTCGQIIGDKDGFIKLVFEVPSRRLRGVHIFGERATELIHIGQMVMEFGGSIDVFVNGVFNYPTLSEAYKYAAYDGLGNVAGERKAGAS